MIRSARACYFCGAVGGMSKEHVWPRWLREMSVDLTDSTTTWSSGFDITAPGKVIEAPLIQMTKQGSPITAKVREVCRVCNSGWMSGLEQDVRPTIRRVTLASFPIGVTTLSPEEACRLAVWALKSAWMRELATPGHRTPTLEMRAYLKDQLMPPANAQVWAARHAGQLDFHARTAQARIVHQDHAWDSGFEPRHALVCTLTFSRLSLLSVTTDGTGVPPMAPDPSLWTPLWPFDGGVTWPPLESVSDTEVAAVTTHLGRWLRVL